MSDLNIEDTHAQPENILTPESPEAYQARAANALVTALTHSLRAEGVQIPDESISKALEIVQPDTFLRDYRIWEQTALDGTHNLDFAQWREKYHEAVKARMEGFK